MIQVDTKWLLLKEKQSAGRFGYFRWGSYFWSWT